MKIEREDYYRYKYKKSAKPYCLYFTHNTVRPNRSASRQVVNGLYYAPPR